MVKFGKYLDSHLVPEWRPAYCNYRILKKELKKVQRNEACGVAANEGTVEGALRGPCLQNIYRRSREDVILVHRKTSDLVETELLAVSAQAESEKPFFGKLDAELNKVNEFFKSKEMEFFQHADILEKQMQALFELKVMVDSPQHRSSTEDQDLCAPLMGDKSVPMMDTVVSRHNEMLFQTISNEKVMMGNSAMLLARKQLASMRDQLGYPDNMCTPGSTGISKDSRSLSENVSLNLNSLGDLKTDKVGDFASFKNMVKKSEKMLCEAFVEFYRGLGLLKSYRSLNVLAFTKILKKYEKVALRGASSTYMRTVENSYFNTSDRVVNLITWVEAMFTDYFTDGDRYKARKALTVVKGKATSRITFFLGMFTGCSLMLAVAFGAVIHVLFANMTDSQQTAWTTVYMRAICPVFGTMALLLLHMYMYGWNLYCWRRTRINYAFIFEFAPGTELSYREVLLVCTGLTVVLGGGMLAHLAAQNSESVLIDLIPLGTFLVFIGLLFCPFNICYQSSRKFFLNRIFRVICAPFYPVQLVDFFIGDQLCSQAPLLRNAEYIICYYACGYFKTENSDACLNNQRFMEISYTLSVLPYWWRLMQCLRRYRDEKGRAHLANGGKYFSAMIVVIVRTQYGTTETASWLMLYIMVSAFATFYQIYWDLVVDWGLLRRNPINPWLREKLILENQRYIYFTSMGLNVMLRFPWLLSISHFQFGGLDKHIIDFLLAAVEIVRRGLWNFYRLENEHLNNVGHYRATKNVPLPFANN